MAYRGIALYTDKTFEEIDLDYNELVVIEGNATRARYLANSPYILYEQYGAPRTKENSTRVATKLVGCRIFGTVVIVDETIEEVPNEDYDPPEFDEEGGDVDGEEEDDAYITKRADINVDLFLLLCHSIGINI
jgi:hypothetical protein